MNCSPATLPAMPPSALFGLPTAVELPRPGDRRRYAHHLACALVGIPSWTLDVAHRDQVPVGLKLEAAREDWPLIGTGTHLTIMRPVPLPDVAEGLFAQALAQVPTHLRPQVHQVLVRTWAGEMPEPPTPEVAQLIGEAILQAATRADREAIAAARAARGAAMPILAVGSRS